MTLTAADVKKAYTARRRKLSPKWQPAERWDTCWEKTAAFLEGNKIDLGTFIEAQFRLKKPFPMPTQLYNTQAMERFMSYQPGTETLEAERRLEVEMGYLETRLALGYPLDWVLGASQDRMSPLFRYCVSVYMGRQDLADDWRELAEDQLRRSPALRDIYASILPEGI